MIKYSFIIPVKEINGYIRESIPKILKIKRNDYENIIYPDNVNSEKWDKTKQISTGSIGPAEKRSLAIRDAQGEILIFIDDDAYPTDNFLDILEKDFIDENIMAVGGPAITPKNDSFWQKVSGAVFLSSLSGGYPERYISAGKKKFINDWPSVNLSVRKNAFAKIGGFDCNYWPGEDTKLCIDLINKTKGKILYNPELIAYHHRREGLKKHLKQIAGYGIHRGFFAKKYPQTSFKLKYFIPSAFLLFVIVGGVLSFFSDLIFKLYLLGWGLYFLALIKSFVDIYKYEKNVLIILNSLYYIFLTHLVYGFRFIQGFIFTKELKSKLR
jgi:cellulose synthase/poly-beta-1,6-N-acetylglucosamine synthase-like glycosyltransferase